MPVVNPPQPAEANAQLSTLCITLRNTFDAITDFAQWMSNATLTELQTIFGVDAASAQTIQSTVGNLSHLADVYRGDATQTPALDFEANSSPFWQGK